MSTDLGITKLDSPFWTRIQSEIDEVAPRDNPKEEEIWDCAVGRKYQAYSLWIWCRCNSRDFPAYTEKSKLWPLWWNTIRSECSPSCSIHTKKFENYFSLKKKKKFGPHSSVHHWDPHKIRIHIVTSPLTQPHSPDIAPSDFHHFCLLKDGLLGQHYMDEALQNTVQQWRANFTCR